MANKVWNDKITYGTELPAALTELINRYNATPGYTQKTADQIRQQAQNEVSTAYNQNRLAAQQAADRSDLALQQQLAGLGTSYARQREALQNDINAAYSKADRQMLSRGMQRSSYGSQILSNVQRQGNKALGELEEQRTQQEGNIYAQRTQLAQQLADQLRQYDTDEQTAILNRIAQLEDQEYQRGVQSDNTRNALATQIYEFIASQAATKSSGKSGGSSKSSSSSTEKTTPANTSTDPMAQLYAILAADAQPSGGAKPQLPTIVQNTKSTVPPANTYARNTAVYGAEDNSHTALWSNLGNTRGRKTLEDQLQESINAQKKKKPTTPVPVR